MLVYSTGAGVHYNNARDMLGPGGVVEMKGVYSRDEHRQNLHMALTRLSRMDERCSGGVGGDRSRDGGRGRRWEVTGAAREPLPPASEEANRGGAQSA